MLTAQGQPIPLRDPVTLYCRYLSNFLMELVKGLKDPDLRWETLNMVFCEEATRQFPEPSSPLISERSSPMK